VLGAEDLNALLRKYADIEKKHFKLWIASTEVLRAVLNNDLFSRSYLEVEAIKTRLSLFVPTDAVERALAIIRSSGVCLLSGIPGIGKTTAAEILVALMLDEGWECVCISANIAEAHRAYDRTQRQLFYYDDFLGTTSLRDKLGKNEDRDLVRLIRTCSTRPATKRLILTTRNYLFAQAVEQHELLQRTSLEASTCVVEMADYTSQVRAQILVNHLWFFGVNEKWCSRLVQSGSAREIVDHPNYSPRLIEAICDTIASGERTANSFAKKSLALLDDPSQLWRHAYNEHLSGNARDLLICHASLGSGCYVNSLRESYLSFASLPTHGLITQERFNRAFRELEGTFVRVEMAGRFRTATYNNPSLKDFVDGMVANEPAYSRRIVELATNYDQVQYAAPYLMQLAPGVETESLICQSLKRHLLGKSALPERLYGNVYVDLPVRPAQRLLAWRQLCANGRPHSIRLELCKLAISYLSGRKISNEVASDVADLARITMIDAIEFGIDATVIVSSTLSWLWRNIKSVKDHLSMWRWIDEWEDSKNKNKALDKLREAFVTAVATVTVELNSSDYSSSRIDQCIDEITMAADQLGIDMEEIDLSEAESARDIAMQQEDLAADCAHEEWQLQRFEELKADQQVNDILDSLRQ